jgi:glycine/D-amino acid oxidase-like deaminating enzyme
MNRRALLTALGALAVGGAGGFALGRWGGLFETSPPAPPRLKLPLVNVSRERVIRTVVGLRPYRKSGFRVEHQVFVDKTVIHNYGHGGGGVSLSWGSAHLAMEELAKAGGIPEKAAVVGAGAVGLATARLLQRAGAAVTVYAKDLPPHTTSNVAAAQWNPFLVSAKGDRFERAARFAHREFQTLVSEHYGVRWRTNYAIGGGVREDALRDLFPEARTLAPGTHPFPHEHVGQFATMMIETPIYLAALLRDVALAGGRIVVRAFSDLTQLLALPEPVIFNCTGLGARALVGDQDLVPVKGQLTVLLPQPEIDYVTLYGSLYMMPRRDGILLGGTYEGDEWSLEPNRAAEDQILEGHAAFFAAMAAPEGTNARAER